MKDIFIDERYRIDYKIGEGELGVVYAAYAQPISALDAAPKIVALANHKLTTLRSLLNERYPRVVVTDVKLTLS